MIERRKFFKNFSAALIAAPVVACSSSFPKQSGPSTAVPTSVLPQHFRPGDTIGLISPAGAIYESEPYAIAIESLEAMGLSVKEGEFLEAAMATLEARMKTGPKHLSEDCRLLLKNADQVIDVNILKDPTYRIATDKL